MIRVLEDLKRYARLNGMPALAEHLGEAVVLAMTEASGWDNNKGDAPPDGAQGGKMG